MSEKDEDIKNTNITLSEKNKELDEVLEKKKENLFKKVENLEIKLDLLIEQVRNILIGK